MPTETTNDGSRLAWLDNPTVCPKLGTDEELMKRLVHDLDEETSATRVEKAFLSIARNDAACDIIRALIKAMPDREMTILNNAAAIYSKYGPHEDVLRLYPVVLEYQRKTETGTHKA